MPIPFYRQNMLIGKTHRQLIVRVRVDEVLRTSTRLPGECNFYVASYLDVRCELFSIIYDFCFLRSVKLVHYTDRYWLNLSVRLEVIPNVAALADIKKNM